MQPLFSSKLFLILIIPSLLSGCARGTPAADGKPDTDDAGGPEVAGEPADAGETSGTSDPEEREEKTEAPAAEPAEDRKPKGPADYETLRRKMVETQVVSRGITNPKVLEAMLAVPRHKFVPYRHRRRAYDDHPLPIGENQTISQPLIVAWMSDLSGAGPGDTVLEIGTGSGYHAAVLAEMGATVYTIEIVESLARSARLVLEALGYENIHVRHGDGYQGWPEHAPFDSVVVTAAPSKVPEPLLEQLATGGRLVLPVGEQNQYLEVYTRTEEGFERERHGAVRFVPMTGKAQEKR